MHWSWTWISCILGIALPEIFTINAGPEIDEIIERFEYRSKTINPASSDPDVKLEFLVIGRPVSWTEAEVLCPSYVQRKLSRFDDDEEDEDVKEIIAPNSSEKYTQGNGHLATIDTNDLAKWLARRLAESNYRYDGLWIGGHRKRDNDTWTWIGLREHENNVIPQQSSESGYPPWYKDDHRNFNRNCLAFDKQGHDLPLFVEEDCHVRRTFVCQRFSKRSTRDLLKEGHNVTVDGQHYTLYHFSDDDEENDVHSHEAVKKLNGGGIKWKDALLECHRRGQELAVVPSNEAAAAIADIMLKSRPSIESAWLGGWSADEAEWTWVSSGALLPSVKSSLTEYPPWNTDDVPHVPSTELSSVGAYYETKAKCLILDRHLCPQHVDPVFLSLDCEKRRPFVCQAVQPQHLRNDGADFDNEFVVNGNAMKFSKSRMTWRDGKAHCEETGSVMAKINDSETLHTVLDQMATLSLDHAWVGGHTRLVNGDWKWLDVNGESLEFDGQSSWLCTNEENKRWPDAKPDLCLNLDREGRGHLFYGLECNETKQHVLCAHNKRNDYNEMKSKLRNETDCSQVEPPSSVGNGSWVCNLTSDVSLCGLQCKFGLSPVPVFFNACAETPDDHQIKCLGISDLAATILHRVSEIIEANSKVGFLFVLDDSMSVLNVWFVEQLKLVAVIIQTVFRLSVDHPMGLITFSTEAKEAISMNETEECLALSKLANQVFVSRGVDWNYRLENGTSRKTTDITNAVRQASRVLNTSEFPQNIVLFITDGEQTEEGPEAITKKHQAVEELAHLRALGHETLALLITQGQSQGDQDHPDYEMMGKLFPNSANGESNLFALNNYQMLADLVSTLNETRQPHSENCEQPHWIIPEDHPLLTHLLQYRK